MPDLYTRPLRASVRELPQESDINFAEIRVAAQKLAFEADALMCTVFTKTIWGDD